MAMRLVAVLVAAVAADLNSGYSDASPGSTTESPAQRQWNELKKQEADKLWEGQQALGQLQTWLSDIEGQEKDTAQVGKVIEQIENEAEEGVKSRRSSLENQFETSLEQLTKLSREVTSQSDVQSLKEEAKKDAADALWAAKELEHLEKEKQKNMMTSYHAIRSKAKSKASELMKEVMHDARDSFKFAHKAESVGRKAGQKESQYEGDEEHAEKVTEHLSGQGEHAGEKAEDKVEGFFEKIEEKIEGRRDSLEHEAENKAEARKTEVKEAKRKFEAAIQTATAPAPAPAVEAVQLRGSAASLSGASGFVVPGFLLGVGLSLVFVNFAWSRTARLVSTPEALG